MIFLLQLKMVLKSFSIWKIKEKFKDKSAGSFVVTSTRFIRHNIKNLLYFLLLHQIIVDIINPPKMIEVSKIK